MTSLPGCEVELKSRYSMRGWRTDEKCDNNCTNESSQHRGTKLIITVLDGSVLLNEYLAKRSTD